MTPSASDTTATGRGRNGHDRDRRITRDDLEAKFRELASDVEEGAETAQQIGVVVAAVGITVLVVGAFLLGRRRGKRSRTVLEIRRL